MVCRVSVHGPDEQPGSASLLYSGMLTDGVKANDVAEYLAKTGAGTRRIVDDTPAARFLNSNEFDEALKRVKPDSTERGNFLFHATDGPWAVVSGRFVEAANGPVVTLTAAAPDGRIYAATGLRLDIDAGSRACLGVHTGTLLADIEGAGVDLGDRARTLPSVEDLSPGLRQAHHDRWQRGIEAISRIEPPDTSEEWARQLRSLLSLPLRLSPRP